MRTGQGTGASPAYCRSCCPGEQHRAVPLPQSSGSGADREGLWPTQAWPEALFRQRSPRTGTSAGLCSSLTLQHGWDLGLPPRQRWAKPLLLP